MLGCIVILPNVVFQWLGYVRFCKESSLDRPYCHRATPSIYSFVQDHYWFVLHHPNHDDHHLTPPPSPSLSLTISSCEHRNNGLFRYWTLKQMPNFLLASPILLFSIAGIARYSSANWKAMLTAGLSRTNRTSKRGYLNANVQCFVYYWLICVLLLVLYAHVQIATRFLSACPALYWYAALQCEGKHALANARVLLLYSLSYNVIGTCLFVNFYPWT